eukprot:TRINITY_DN36063_c0_g1_i1.p5 TRINITY_DN36063_c0_g1~~TRINITY_DN36063_c0_g1_i1.p5  ORF type:complete len:121 (-),score=17.46 TRINITY_DN36063_c0_g1_i1:202-564(-)
MPSQIGPGEAQILASSPGTIASNPPKGGRAAWHSIRSLLRRTGRATSGGSMDASNLRQRIRKRKKQRGQFIKKQIIKQKLKQIQIMNKLILQLLLQKYNTQIKKKKKKKTVLDEIARPKA